jgi:3-mercaptopyruvate sulfurtransferase SseA
VPRGRPVYLICQGGFRSLRAAQFLRQQGFEDVVSVKGGTEAWRAAGKPLAPGDARAEPPRVVETEWTHAGASTYVI